MTENVSQEEYDRLLREILSEDEDIATREPAPSTTSRSKSRSPSRSPNAPLTKRDSSPSQSNASTVTSLATPNGRHTSNSNVQVTNARKNATMNASDLAPACNGFANGLPSTASLEERFQAVRIQDADLPTTPESNLRNAISELLRIQEDLGVLVSGGALSFADSPSLSGSRGGLGSVLRRKKVQQLREAVEKEIALYEEFIRRANEFTLERILNEPDVSDEEWKLESEADSLSEQNEDTASEVSVTRSDMSHLSLPIMRPHLYHSINPPSASQFPSSGRSMSTGIGQLHRLNSTSSIPSYMLSSSRRNSNSSFSLSIQSQNASSSQFGDFGYLDNSRPWEPFRWNRLVKISDHLYSATMRESTGLSTVMDVKGALAIGTSRGLVLVYDYAQNIKAVLGNSALAIEHGAITAVSFSADHCYLISGHALGTIIVWDVQRTTAVRTISASSHLSSSRTRRRDGHTKGSAIVHASFVGNTRNEMVTGDDRGMAFYHLISKIMLVNTVETVRLLGRYPDTASPTPLTSNFAKTPEVNSTQQRSAHKPSTIFSMSVLPIGQTSHPAEALALVALLTPYNLIVVGLKPVVKTYFKLPRSKTLVANQPASSLPAGSTPSIQLPPCGCVAWCPSGPSEVSNGLDGAADRPTAEPLLAISWGSHLLLYRVHVVQQQLESDVRQDKRKKEQQRQSFQQPQLEFLWMGEWRGSTANILAIEWLTSRILLLFTSEEEIIVFDPYVMQPHDRSDAKPHSLVYHDRYSGALKAASTYLDAPRVPAEMSYAGSIRVHREKLFCLGLDKIFIGTPLTWTNRLDALAKSGDYSVALHLASKFYTGHAGIAILGLPENDAERHSLVEKRIVHLVDEALDKAYPESRIKQLHELEARYATPPTSLAFVVPSTDAPRASAFSEEDRVFDHDLVSSCQDACIVSHQEEFLFGEVYDRFVDSGKAEVFLSTLIPHILSGKTRTIPPTVTRDLLSHVKSNSPPFSISLLEDLILQIDPTSFDIHSTLSICAAERLHTASAYIWNRTLGDYISPIIEQLVYIRHHLGISPQCKEVQPAVKGNESISANDGKNSAYRLYVYLAHLLTGKSYPSGLPMVGIDARVARATIYDFLLSRGPQRWPCPDGKIAAAFNVENVEERENDVEGTCESPMTAARRWEPTFPYLRLLLKFDAGEMLRVLGVGLEDSYMEGEDLFDKNENLGSNGQSVVNRQTITDVLLDMAEEEPQERREGRVATWALTFAERSRVYCFVAKCATQYPKQISVPKFNLHHAVLTLASDSDKATCDERQAAIEGLLLRRIYTPANREEERRLLLLYESAGFHRLLETAYKIEGRYGAVIGTYLNDNNRFSEVFQAIEDMLGPQSRLTENQKAEVRNVAMLKLSGLVAIDGTKTGLLVSRYLGGNHADALTRLAGDASREYAYLRGIFEPSSQSIEASATENIPRNVAKQGDPSIRKMGIWHYPNSGDLDAANEGRQAIEPSSKMAEVVEPEIHERYIELMCHFDPSGVLRYLQAHEDRAHRLNRVLEFCRNAGVVDALVWILERGGDLASALSMILSIVRGRVDRIVECIAGRRTQDVGNFKGTWVARWTAEEQEEIKETTVRIRAVLRLAMQLCERSTRSQAADDYSAIVNATRNVGNDAEVLWFRLLDLFVESAMRVSAALSDIARPLRAESDDKDPFPSSILDGGMISPSAVTSPPATSPACSQNSPRQVRRANPYSEHFHHYLQNVFHDYLQTILTTLLLTATSSVVRPAALLRRLVDGQQKTTTFHQLRTVLIGLFETYKYEEMLFAITNLLFGRDLFEGIRGVVKGRTRGWRPRQGGCLACREPLWTVPTYHFPQRSLPPDPRPIASVPTSSSSAAPDGPSSSSSSPSPFRVEMVDDSIEQGANIGPKGSVLIIDPKAVVVFRCGHGYHHSCLNDHRIYICPLCRIPVRTYPSASYAGNKIPRVTQSRKGKERAMD